MWKCVSRSFREALGCLEQPRISTCRLWEFRRAGRDPTASSGDSSEKHQESSDWSSAYCRDPTDTLLGAVTCSSALALGWVLTKPFVHARKWRCDAGSNCTGCTALFGGRRPLLVALAQGSELAKHSTSATDPPQITSGDHHSVPYGPLTAEQAIEEATNDLNQAHNAATAVAANLRGIELAASNSSRKRRQAYQAFLQAYNSNHYPPAAYNIAQCHELGIGTQQDFAAAAQWYKIGADLDHAASTYNLAVFYAHGWGGLTADPATARRLLSRAAELGSPEARTALGQKTETSQVAEKVCTEQWTIDGESEAPEVPEENDSHDYCSPDEFASDPEKVYRLAQCFEKSPSESCDPHLVMDLYGFASDLGHKAAAAKLQVLKAYEAIGLLSEFLWSSGNIDKGLLCDIEYALLDARTKE